MILAALLACAAVPASVPAAVPAAESSSEFWAHWGDGKAEIASYDLVQPRYGDLHPGTVVLITVTEDFSWSERVKADPGQHPDDDIRKVVKLNAMRTFQTGIYTYDVMSSVFARVDAGDGMRALDPIKLTFSAQEWCGMVYDEVVMGPGSFEETGHTYFDADTRAPSSRKVPSDLVYGDALPLLVRGLEGDWIAAGASRTVPFRPSQMEQRFAHQAAAVGTARLSRGAASEALTVPAGSYTVDRYDVAVEGGETTTWFIESAAPHRIIAWKSTAGEHAELRGSDRLPYWQLNNPEDVGARAKVGL